MLEDKLRNILTAKDGIADEVNSVPDIYDYIITETTRLAEYPQKVGKAISISYKNGQEYGRIVEAQRWIDITTSATATEEDVAKGKTFVDDYGEIKDGTLDVETLKEEGRQEEYDRFWDILQNYGKRTNYSEAFTIGWTKKNFRPKYDIKPTFAYQFNISGDYNQLLEEGQVIMKDLEEEQGITFDFSKCPNLTRLNAGALFKELNVIDMTGSESLADLAFYSGYIPYNLRLVLGLRRIERLILWEKNKFDDFTFGYSEALEYIGFEGVFATNGLNLKWSTKLDKESHIKLVNTLSSTTSGLSVTVSKTAVNKAFETSAGANDGSTSQEWLNLIATKSNWTISLG